MVTTSAKDIVLAKIDAIRAGDFTKAMSFYHDEIDFIGYAPVELFPLLGQRRGKIEVMRTLTSIHERYLRRRTEIEFVAGEDDRVSAIISVHLEKRENKRIVPLRTAHFYRVRDGLIAQQRMFLDSFDTLQQVKGVELTEIVAKLQPPIRPRSR